MVCPAGCVCQAVLAPGSKVTKAPAPTVFSCLGKTGSILTVPENHSSDPFADGIAPFLYVKWF